jgi:hypothetical protein
VDYSTAIDIQVKHPATMIIAATNVAAHFASQLATDEF